MTRANDNDNDDTAAETADDGRSVRLERLLPGPISRVWERLTAPEHLDAWLGADGGVVTGREPPRRLSYTSPTDGATVTLELEPRRGGQVLLVLTHRRGAALAPPTTACALPLAA